MRAKGWWVRAAQSLVGAVGGAVVIGEGSERYDASRHVVYATQQLQARRTRLEQADKLAEQPDAGSLLLQRETPKFPYVVVTPPADDPASVASALIGTTEHVVGSPHETTAATLDALIVANAPLDALVQRVAWQWQRFKSRLHGNVPAAFDPQREKLTARLATVLAALRAMDSNANGKAEEEEEKEKETSESLGGGAFIFFLRDYDDWDDATKTAWFRWVHSVTTASLAHVVLPTRAAVTPTTISDWQRVHRVPEAEFVALLLRPATRACDQRSAIEKLRVLSQRFALDLRGLDETDEGIEEAEDVIGFAPPAPPTEAQLIAETVGEWWTDQEIICRALAIRGLGGLESDDERLVRVQQVCDEYERETMLHILSTLGLFDEAGDDSERRISALQAWKCLEVVTGVSAEAQVVVSPDTLLRRDTDKPLHCVHPVEALLPFNQRVHGEAKFLELVDKGILLLRPKNDVEIGVVPCDTKSLVAPCWVETRPVVARAFAKLWRDDVNYMQVLELERLEDKYKMAEELDLFEAEIHERRKELDVQTREFIFLQHTMKKAQVAQRRAELSLLELEIQSKTAYLERLRSLLD